MLVWLIFSASSFDGRLCFTTGSLGVCTHSITAQLLMSSLCGFESPLQRITSLGSSCFVLAECLELEFQALLVLAYQTYALGLVRERKLFCCLVTDLG